MVTARHWRRRAGRERGLSAAPRLCPQAPARRARQAWRAGAPRAGGAVGPASVLQYCLAPNSAPPLGSQTLGPALGWRRQGGSRLPLQGRAAPAASRPARPLGSGPRAWLRSPRARPEASCIPSSLLRAPGSGAPSARVSPTNSASSGSSLLAKAALPRQPGCLLTSVGWVPPSLPQPGRGVRRVAALLSASPGRAARPPTLRCVHCACDTTIYRRIAHVIASLPSAPHHATQVVPPAPPTPLVVHPAAFASQSFQPLPC